jgi:hypothetical protein
LTRCGGGKNVKTHLTKPADIQAEWWIVDATGQNLGRLASRIAQILRGKHKPYFDPSQDCGARAQVGYLRVYALLFVLGALILLGVMRW